MSDLLERYSALLLRASSGDKLAIHQAGEMFSDARHKARLVMHGCKGLTQDLAAVMAARELANLDVRVRIDPEHMAVLQSPVVQTLFPEAINLCQQ